MRNSKRQERLNSGSNAKPRNISLSENFYMPFTGIVRNDLLYADYERLGTNDYETFHFLKGGSIATDT